MAKTARKRLTRAESQAETRRRLVGATCQRVVRHGFGGASIRDIVAAAGYSQGAFYSNFPDKEAVLLELMRQHMTAEVQEIDAVLDEVDRTGDNVVERLEAWSREMDKDASWSILAVELLLHANRSAAFATAYRRLWENHRRALGRLIGRMFKQLELRPPAEPGELAAGFMALAHGFALQRAIATPNKGHMIMVFLRGIIASAGKAPSRLKAKTQ